MRNWIYLFLVIFLLALTSGCGGGGSKGATLNGTVVNGGTDAPIAGVRVALGSISATSKADGSFSLTGLPLGTKLLTAQLSGYEITTMSVTIVEGSNGPTRVLMAPETGTPPPPPF